MKSSSLSYVIPSYNATATLRETVESIFEGNFNPGDEIIIVDDCSTDQTELLTNELVERHHPHLRVIKNQVNLGCPASRNVGIRQAKNDLIFSLDSDNRLAPNSVPSLKQALLDHQADLATFSKVKFFASTIDKITHEWIFKTGWFGLEDLFAGNLNPAYLNNYLFTKASWEKVGGFQEWHQGLHEAWIFTLKELFAGAKMWVSSTGFYYHRFGHESLTIREYKKQNMEKEILSLALQDKLEIFPAAEKEYILTHNPEWLHNLNHRPVRLMAGQVGHNGRLRRTPYGLYRSIKKKIKCWLHL